MIEPISWLPYDENGHTVKLYKLNESVTKKFRITVLDLCHGTSDLSMNAFKVYLVGERDGPWNEK